jgi:hypothetical protein
MFGLRTGYGIEQKTGLAVKSEIPSVVEHLLISTSTRQR